jgi:23S rRNA (guanosine2251-2'-O)-methyltransferase
MDSQLIYGKQPVAEAERGRRRVQRVWRAPETPSEGLERICGSPDHQGVVAEVDPYPYADRNQLLRVESALIVALDQVQDPRNLGAVARSAEAAGAVGLVIPDRRSAEVTPAACKASAGAVEHLPIAKVPNLADWLAEAKDAGFWIWGADADADQAPWSVDLKGSTILVLGGQGNSAPCRLVLRWPRCLSPARQGRLAERLGSRRGAALRGRPAALATAIAIAPISAWG